MGKWMRTLEEETSVQCLYQSSLRGPKVFHFTINTIITKQQSEDGLHPLPHFRRNFLDKLASTCCRRVSFLLKITENLSSPAKHFCKYLCHREIKKQITTITKSYYKYF